MAARLPDAITAKALALALQPSFDVEHAAAILAAIGSPYALRVSLARMRRALAERHSAVGERAALSLAHALDRLTVEALVAAS